MIIKNRCETLELLVLRYLNTRTNLPESELSHYRLLEKGFEGETNFDQLVENLQGDFIGMFDLLFEINNTIFQIDSLIISGENIYLFDVKNFDGDYYVCSDNKWYSITEIEIKNPIHQLNRCETLLKRLLQNIGCNQLISSNVIFINPNFYLYQAPINLPIIFPTQIKRFLQKLDLTLQKSKIKDKQVKLAEKLLAHNLDTSPYIRKPEYTYDQLKKGIYCKECHSFEVYTNSKMVVCKICGFREKIENSVLRNIEEYKVLFPDKKITTSSIQEWCKIIDSVTTVRRIISINHKPVGKFRNTYYIDK
ncbi:nuclease-related domain-containing protein [Calidifontibacillus oryziterrae]|uniref:nuclease-related domain-containing protein n=1 Tax=Calidifontibacillus oryziterrae TaxID=1191699 RepID=UPI0002D31684|nr:nuclease-related domain-containing protein [Calidifontibacillus oryziterrae]